jgi:hypothetical protein
MTCSFLGRFLRMDPGRQAEQFVASEIAELTGEAPEHEPAAARLPNGGVADFRVLGDSLGHPGRFLLVEVKSLHDVTSGIRNWRVDSAMNHLDMPKTWPARTEWTRAGEQRLRKLEVSPAELTSPDALRNLTSNERLRALADRGGQLYQLAASANQFAVMILFGSTATTNPALRWPAKAVSGPFPGVVPESLRHLAVAFFPGETGRPSVGRDIRASLEKKFAGYNGPDARVAVVVSDTDREETWPALLGGRVSYRLDGSGPVLQVDRDFLVPGLLVAVHARELGDQPRWSYRAAGSVDTADGFEDVCSIALRAARHPARTPAPTSPR